MRSLSIIFLVLTFVGYNKILNAQDYFPLQIGNKIQYHDSYFYHGPGGSQSGTRYAKFIVSQDSLINGETFYQINPNPGLFHHPYEENFLFRNDTLNQKLYVKQPGDSTVRLAVDFNIPADSSFISYMIRWCPILVTSEGMGIDTILGQVVQTFEITYDAACHGDIEGNYIFAENFGIIKHDGYWWLGTQLSSDKFEIVSAIIDSIIYNPLILEVTNLSPLIDRPIDTFPFVLNGSYSASIRSLVDSFYVRIIQSRADTVVRSWIIEFESGQLFVPIYSSMLQVGDKIKVRAKATDESIFENVAYYPDTGYAIITVLPPIVGIKTEEARFIYKLGQNYPNPFNPSTIISYEIAENQKVELKIFDVLGNNIATLVDEEKSPGRYEIEFDGSLLSSGVYFYKLIADDFTQTRKMILSK